METASSSKATVEYHDPSGVFPLVARHIAARLPLRNLNWQSPPRPLRQIKSLHVDFVPDKHTAQNSLKPPLLRSDSNGLQNSIDIVRSGVKSAKERRHQISGFRTSPYLKIYVLRCDDKEAYKESDRKRIRDWIKENAQSEGKQNHDACEWLILHLVVPDTVAASEPRWRESSKDPDDLKERKGGSKLIGKSTKTVFDRLRADFNDSGKTAIDRVAQIRVLKEDVPGDLLPTPAVASTYEETQQERENAWADLISKFKSLLLGPFDRRVRQYEADIAEQESRRSLPGWNFCTFFIHKEGLAKALESIGLVEDALAIYDELSVGLESVLRDLAAGQDRGSATSFAAYTDDIEPRITCSEQEQVHTNGSSHEVKKEQKEAAALFSKDYRESIVRSNISVFDFMCYIFVRQKTLILRLANAQSARLESGPTKEGGEDLVLTSEVCWRASTFINTATRALRHDLLQSPKGRDRPAIETESLVSSWTWAVAGQVLDETTVPALLELTKHGLHDPKQVANGGHKRPKSTVGSGGNAHPQRISSLGEKGVRDLSRPATRHPSGDHDSRPGTSGSAGAGAVAAVGLPGQAELATYRAELIMTRRRILEQLARRRGWYVGWAFARRAEQQRDSVNAGSGTADTHSPWSPQCLGPTLKSILHERSAFKYAYESVTDMAIKHYHTATQTKFAETLLGDLAMLKCQQDDFLSAATYLEHVLPLHAGGTWESMEMETLRAYAFCLRHLQRHREYVQTTLTLLAKVADQNRTKAHVRRTQASHMRSRGAPDLKGKFMEVAGLSMEFDADVTQPLKRFFDQVKLNTTVVHQDESDAFKLTLSLNHILEDEIELDEATVRLVSSQDPSQEIWLSRHGPITLKPGSNEIELEGRTITYGAFLPDTISLKSKRLCFIENLRTRPEPTPLGISVVEPTTTLRDSRKPPEYVFLHPSKNGLFAELRRSSSIHVDKPRGMEIVLHSGRNENTHMEMTAKPTTAGLRLHLGDARLEGVEINSQGPEVKGQICLGALAAGSTATVTIPYTVEQSTKEVTLRIEITYHTQHGSFNFLPSARLPNELPLDIDVNDVFQLDALYSSFTVRTTTPVPLRITAAALEDSPVYEVEAPPSLPLLLTILDSEPLDLVYKIRRKNSPENQVLKKDAALVLALQYQPMDELVLVQAKDMFMSQLNQSPYDQYERLLVPLLLDALKQNLAQDELTMAALLGELSLPSFETVGWPELVRTLSIDVRAPLAEWLQQWHDSHTTLNLPDSLDSTTVQHVRTSVDVPNIDMVFSTSLTLPDIEPLVPSTPKVLIMGQPVSATVRIKHTSTWSAKHIFPNVPTFKIHGTTDEEKPSFVVEVSNEADTWLVGGQKRRRITIPPEDDKTVHTYTILLIPLKLGLQPLPFIEVQQERGHVLDGNGDMHHDEAMEGSCETFCETAGELVNVVRGERRVVVNVPESREMMVRAGLSAGLSGGLNGGGGSGGSRPGTGVGGG